LRHLWYGHASSEGLYRHNPGIQVLRDALKSNSLRCDHDLIASPACMVMKAAGEFKNKKTAPNQLWQTDFTYARQLTSWVCLSISRGRIYAQL
jgi:hypothetical protein